MRTKFREYYRLVKPGIIHSNLLTAVAGFFLGIEDTISFVALTGLVTGMWLVIGAACVFNNYIDRDIDSKMSRTKVRATVSGTIRPRTILLFGTTLAVIGFVILAFTTNPATMVLGAIGFTSYVALYTPAKHRTPYATLIGTIPGAVPPIAGYAAAGGADWRVGGLLGLVLIAWQMPHFFAIAVRRQDEYAAAHVPIWPIWHGFVSTRRQMLFYGILFLVSSALLGCATDLGLGYVVIMICIGVYWLYLIALRPQHPEDQQKWAKTVFLFSLLILPLFSALLIARGLLRLLG